MQVRQQNNQNCLAGNVGLTRAEKREDSKQLIINPDFVFQLSEICLLRFQKNSTRKCLLLTGENKMFVTAQHTCFNSFSCVLKERMKPDEHHVRSTSVPVSYTHLTLPTIYSV